MGFLDWVRGVNDKLEPQTGRSDGAAEAAALVPTEDDIVGALDRTMTMAREARLSPVVISRVGRVSRLVRETMPRMRNQGMGSSDFYAVMATATDYLPEALSAYLRLPRDWADSRPIVNGKTSLMLLIDQLDLLGATMDNIFDAVNRQDAKALIAHGRFLTERFGGTADITPSDAASEPDPAVPKNPLDL